MLRFVHTVESLCDERGTDVGPSPSRQWSGSVSCAAGVKDPGLATHRTCWQRGQWHLLPAVHRGWVWEIWEDDHAGDPKVGPRCPCTPAICPPISLSCLLRSSQSCVLTLLSGWLWPTGWRTKASEQRTSLTLHRCNLASVMLQLLAMKVPNVLTFDFMSKPSPGEWPLQWSGQCPSRQTTACGLSKVF